MRSVLKEVAVNVLHRCDQENERAMNGWGYYDVVAASAARFYDAETVKIFNDEIIRAAKRSQRELIRILKSEVLQELAAERAAANVTNAKAVEDNAEAPYEADLAEIDNLNWESPVDAMAVNVTPAKPIKLKNVLKEVRNAHCERLKIVDTQTSDVIVWLKSTTGDRVEALITVSTTDADRLFSIQPFRDALAQPIADELRRAAREEEYKYLTDYLLQSDREMEEMAGVAEAPYEDELAEIDRLNRAATNAPSAPTTPKVVDQSS